MGTRGDHVGWLGLDDLQRARCQPKPGRGIVAAVARMRPAATRRPAPVQFRLPGRAGDNRLLHRQIRIEAPRPQCYVRIPPDRGHLLAVGVEAQDGDAVFMLAEKRHRFAFLDGQYPRAEGAPFGDKFAILTEPHLIDLKRVKRLPQCPHRFFRVQVP